MTQPKAHISIFSFYFYFEIISGAIYIGVPLLKKLPLLLNGV
jgi:hypothetical protein